MAYAIAAVTIYSWVAMMIWAVSQRAWLTYGNTTVAVIGAFITVVPIIGVLGSTIVAHRVLGKAAVGSGAG